MSAYCTYTNTFMCIYVLLVDGILYQSTLKMLLQYKPHVAMFLIFRFIFRLFFSHFSTSRVVVGSEGCAGLDFDCVWWVIGSVVGPMFTLGLAILGDGDGWCIGRWKCMEFLFQSYRMIHCNAPRCVDFYNFWMTATKELWWRQLQGIEYM